MRVLGLWEEVTVYPPAWGVQGVPLTSYTVRHVRAQLTQLAAATAERQRAPAYMPGQPLSPRLWCSALYPGGLAGLEASWTQRLSGHATTAFGQHVIPMLPCMDLTRQGPRQRNTLVAERVRTGQSQPQPGSPPLPEHRPPALQRHEVARPTLDVGPARAQTGNNVDGARAAALPIMAKCWECIWGAPVSNRIRVFAWRLLHGALPCAAYAAVMHKRARNTAWCPHCDATLPPRTPRPLETYTHLFMLCPTYRPAVDWLLDVWHAVKGVRPPLSAAVVVAGDPATPWPGCPSGHDAACWLALRLTVLFHVWAARQSGAATQQSAAAVVRAAIASLRQEVVLAYNHAHHSADDFVVPQRLLGLPPSQRRRGSFDVWLASGLVRVDVDGSGQRSLRVLLSDSWPVAAPG